MHTHVHILSEKEFEWDPIKERANIRKHGIYFSDAVDVFYDPLAMSQSDPHPDEERYVAVGSDSLLRILVVSYTWPTEGRIRIISARKATRRELSSYMERS